MASEDVPVNDRSGFPISAGKVVKKRNRLPLSCEACRLRKLVVTNTFLPNQPVVLLYLSGGIVGY